MTAGSTETERTLRGDKLNSLNIQNDQLIFERVVLYYYYYYRESHLKIDHLGSNDNLRDTSIISTLKNGFFNSRHNYFSGNYYLSKYCYYYCPFYQNKGTKSQQRAKGNFKINFQGKFVCFEKKSASQELRFRDSFEL